MNAVPVRVGGGVPVGRFESSCLTGAAACATTLLVAATWVAAVGAAPPGVFFEPNVRVTDGSTPFLFQVEPYVAVDPANRLFVGWKEADTADGPGIRVGFARSFDGGLSWSPNVLMDRLYRFQTDPWLALDELGRLYYARLEFSESLFQSQGVAVSRSDDAGATWGPVADADDIRLAFVDKSSIMSDGDGRLYVGYAFVAGGRTVTGGIRVSRSTDSGVSWSSVAISDAATNAIGAVLAAGAGGIVHGAWWDATSGDVFVDRSVDGGITWGADVRINRMPGSARASSSNPHAQPLPTIVATPRGALFVGWAEGSGSDLDIVVARSDDGGTTWGIPVRVNDDASAREQWQPAFAVGPDGTLHLAWLDNRTGAYNVFYATSRDGRRWSANVRVTDAETPSAFQRPGDYLGLATGGDGTAYVVWTDGRNGDLDIFFSRSPPSSGTSGTATTSLAQVPPTRRSERGRSG